MISELESYLDLLQEDYRDLQLAKCDYLEGPPSAVEALRMIHKSHPVLIKGASLDTMLGSPGFSPMKNNSGLHSWDAESLVNLVGGRQLSIAITDDGLADSVRQLNLCEGGNNGGEALVDADSTLQENGHLFENEREIFVKPLTEKMSLADFLDRLREKGDSKEIVYLQSQDGNIYRSHPVNIDPEAKVEGGVERVGNLIEDGKTGPELKAFQDWVERDISWMKEATGSSADAVNLWIGDGRSTTSLHHDPYENVYHVILGTKRFTLLSPIEGLRLKQTFHPSATLVRDPTSSILTPKIDNPSTKIPWISSAVFPETVNPIVVEVKEGETLYLPEGWWHRVDQEEGDERMVIAINYWYPSEMNASRYAHERFARRVARLAGRSGVISVPGDEDEDEDNAEIHQTQVQDDGVCSSEFDSGSGEEWDPKEWGR